MVLKEEEEGTKGREGREEDRRAKEGVGLVFT
jgi:hypothetical protein